MLNFKHEGGVPQKNSESKNYGRDTLARDICLTWKNKMGTLFIYKNPSDLLDFEQLV